MGYLGELFEADWTSTTASKSTTAMAVQSGDVLIIIAGGSSSGTDYNITSDSMGLTWTKTTMFQSSYSPAAMWTATVNSTGNITLQVTRTGGTSYWGFNVVSCRGGSVGTPVTGSGASGGPSLTVTTTTANSTVIMVTNDYNSAGPYTTYRTGAGTPTAFYSSAPGSTYYGLTYPDAGAAGAKVVGLTSSMKWQAIAVEITGIMYAESDVTTSWDVSGYAESDAETSWDVYNAVASDVSTSWQVYSGVNADVSTSWRVDAFADADVTTSWDIASYGNWQDLVRSAPFLEAVAAGSRDVACYSEMVGLDGNPVLSLGYVPLTSGTVTYRGEQAEQWDGQYALKNPSWVPKLTTDPLHPYSTLRIRTWWGVKMRGGAYGYLPLATLHLEDPEIEDTGDNLTITLKGRDALTWARRGGYNGRVLQLGGLTVTQALRRIFDTVAPHAQVVIEETSVTVAAGFEVGGSGARDAAQDWTEIASMAGFVVRTNRMGVIHGGPRPVPGPVKARMIEGPDCRMRSVKRKLKGSTIVNRVVCRSTNPDILEPIVAIVEDKDPDSPTWVGRYGPFQMLIESDAPDTLQAAENMARAAYERNRFPSETTQIQMLSRPDLEYRDTVDIQRRRAGVSGLHYVSGWSMVLPIEGADASVGPMTLDCMTRTLI